MDSKEKDLKDGIRIGDQAAQQPLSGVNIISATTVKGFNGTAMLQVKEVKKSA